VDPRAKKYFSYSPYNYVANNPIIYIDPRGNSINISGNNYVYIIDPVELLSISTGSGAGLRPATEFTPNGVNNLHKTSQHIKQFLFCCSCKKNSGGADQD
jgi:hypothetical protein